MQFGHLKRRELITLLGGATTLSFAASAQQPAMPVIDFPSNIPRESYARLMPAFGQGLRESGFVEGQNVTFEYHWTASERDLPALAAAIVARKPAMIVGVGGDFHREG